MYDDTCRFLAENFSADFASWLLGESITLTELKPSELSLKPIRADALILLQSDDSVLHLEFQTRPKSDIPFRMLDYRVRVYRRYPDKTMRQVVIYLQPTRSDVVRQTSFSMERTRHEFDTLCLWEQPAAIFLQYPGLLPFAVLSQTDDSEATLRQVAQIVNEIPDPITQANLTAASAILAGIRLEEEIIYRLLRRDIMQESVIYRSIQEEAETKAKASMQREIAVNLLHAGVAINIIASTTGLAIEDVQQLQQQITEPPQA
ncbi:Rpn family recombination-promoting nuclease/putative transposase [Nostoc sp. DedSLP04]|uniref:Rpn family recombination-promoting nuclease/putative transposase n=1 Tax=Nostoc sp. DedSLP04 TaxID=3075401 RepID=UPI002AD3AE05|nr:Rpn family recombination-promoting nuclease/putative transposase [Nostoc sp. DedSLP04]MDZ8035677.1 Rpn family recombination-promoting nuclease/putative transposase [Nostoc sp. DedSLP04]